MRITPWRTARQCSEYHVRASRKGVVALVVHATNDIDRGFVLCVTCGKFDCGHAEAVLAALSRAQP